MTFLFTAIVRIICKILLEELKDVFVMIRCQKQNLQRLNSFVFVVLLVLDEMHMTPLCSCCCDVVLHVTH